MAVAITTAFLVAAAAASRSRGGLTEPGCYIDDSDGKPPAHRLLTVMGMPNLSPSVSTRKCAEVCKAKNYTVAGVEAGHACFCGNELAPPVSKVSTLQCCSPCTGNASDACGDVYRLLAFPVDAPPQAPPQMCPQFQPVVDPRHIRSGVTMLRQGYLDQPYCVVMRPTKQQAEARRPGRWICTITGSKGGEGSSSEHVQTLYSDDSGNSWSEPITVEPPPLNTELANAYSTIVTAPGMAAGGGERVYVLYNLDLKNVSHFPDKYVGGNTTVDGVTAPIAFAISGAGERWDGSYVRCAANTTTPPCNATYQGDSWDGAPVWAKEQQPQPQPGKEREYLALLRDTGVWRLTEIRASEAAPGRAAFDTSGEDSRPIRELPPHGGWSRIREGGSEPDERLSLELGNKTIPGGKISRTDCQGFFVMRYSDDSGQSWSAERIKVPYRTTPVDRGNEFGGAVKEMWTVDQTKVKDEVAYFAFTKIGHYLLAPPEEMWVLASRNIRTEPNASLVRWELLPDGEHGVPPPFRNVSTENTIVEEAHVLPLAGKDSGFYMVGRTTLGYLAASWTSDKHAAGGWAPTRYAQYWDPSTSAPAPDNSDGSSSAALVPLDQAKTAFGGLLAGLKNPRGPITPRLIEKGPLAGLHLLLYYNNQVQTYAVTARNPYWLSVGRPGPAPDGGVQLLWSQPEIVIYDTMRSTHPGYPDIIQDPADAERIVITETQKTVSRLHPIPKVILTALERQHSVAALAAEKGAGRTIVSAKDNVRMLQTPALGRFDQVSPDMGDGLTVAVVVEHQSKAKPGDVLLDSRSTDQASNETRAGMALVVGKSGGLVFSIADGQSLVQLETDPTCTAALAGNGTSRHFVGFVADAGPRILRVLVDGVLCDGGGPQQPTALGAGPGHGYSFFEPMGDVRGEDETRVQPSYGGRLVEAQIYERALLTSELVGNYRHAMARLQ